MLKALLNRFAHKAKGKSCSNIKTYGHKAWGGLGI
jgi:hypothetical protein